MTKEKDTEGAANKICRWESREFRGTRREISYNMRPDKGGIQYSKDSKIGKK